MPDCAVDDHCSALEQKERSSSERRNENEEDLMDRTRETLRTTGQLFLISSSEGLAVETNIV